MSGVSAARIETLGKENYDTWKMQVEALLFKNNAWEYVSGEKTRPTGTDAASITEALAWAKADRNARSDLILAISPSELKQVKTCVTSREVWLKLESIYQSKGPARMATLLKQLVLHRMQEDDDVRTHIARFYDAVDKLLDMEVEINPNLLAIMLLYSLPGSFENFRCAIESRDVLPTPEALKVKIIEENDARVEKSKEATPNAMFSGKPFKKFNKQKNNYPKSDKKNSEKQDTKGSFKFRCSKCQKFGHKNADCDQNPKNSKEKAKNVEERANVAKNVSFLVTTDAVEKCAAVKINENRRTNAWCLDSGCTSHMCNDESRFVTMKSLEDEVVNLASSASTEIKAKGMVKLTVSDGKGEQTVDLKNTLYVPDLRTGLVSVAKITDNGFNVFFEKDLASIVDKDGEVVMVADRIDGLYFVREQSQRAGNATTGSTISNVQMWHQRFGHLNERDLRKVVKDEAVSGVKLNDKEKLPPCEVCLKGKLTRAPFPQQSERSSETLDIVHTDVCGPMRVQSIGGARFFVVFIDDSTGWCEVRFLKNKSDVLPEFRKYKSMVENQTGKTIKFLQSDNGKEFCNKEFDELLNTCGIQRRLTISYTPEQNGVAERRNRTLVEMARCMLLQSNSPPRFWAEAIATANHVRNRCPSRSLNGDTAFFRWTGDRPNVRYFRTFGCKAFALDRTPGKGKFESRSRECIFIGYSQECKAYRVWIPSEKKIEATRDIKFLDEFNNEEGYEEFIDEDTLWKRNDTHRGDDTYRRDVPAGCGEVDIEIRSAERDNGEDPPMVVRAQPEDADDGEEGHAEEDENLRVDEAPDGLERPLARRGVGRPRLIRTGARGRPRKEYQPANAQLAEESQDTVEYANVAEVPLKPALSGTDAIEWKDAIRSEFRALLKNKTWEVVDRPRDRNVVTCRIVLRNKCKSDGSLERRKARLVARGFTQRPGVDFHETYAPVARLSSIRLLMALAVKNGLSIHQLDVSTAFLNGELEEEVFMEIPDLFEEMLEGIIAEEESSKNTQIYDEAVKMLGSVCDGNKVLLLRKSLYGLRQAGRQWNLEFDKRLKELGLEPSSADPCVYFAKQGRDLMLVTVYVDDVLVASQNLQWMASMKRKLMSQFEMKDLGNIKYCLGIEFKQEKGRIEMSQKGYILSTLELFGMSDAKPAVTPSDPSTKLTKPEESSTEEMRNYPYRELIGSLMYLSVATRPDIAHSVSALSQFCTDYGKEHWTAAKRVLRYLKGTMDFGLIFKEDNDDLRGFVDSDWGACIIDRRSYTGYAFLLGGAAVSWESRKQRTVALSSTEAEYMALTEAAKEAIYLRRFLQEIGLFGNGPVLIYNDNQGSRDLAKNPTFHARTKHIDMRHHFIRNAIKDDLVKTDYVSTEDMVADILTKGLGGPKLRRFRLGLGLGQT